MDRCQYVRALKSRDKWGEVIYAGYYWCDLSDNPCDYYTTGEICEAWELEKEEIKKEWEDDKP